MCEYQPVWGGVFDFPPESEIVNLTDTHLDRVLAEVTGFRGRIDFADDIDDQTTSGIFLADGIPVLFVRRPTRNSYVCQNTTLFRPVQSAGA